MEISLENLHVDIGLKGLKRGWLRRHWNGNDFSFSRKCNSLSQERFCTWSRFENEGFSNSEVAYWLEFSEGLKNDYSMTSEWKSARLKDVVLEPLSYSKTGVTKKQLVLQLSFKTSWIAMLQVLPPTSEPVL